MTSINVPNVIEHETYAIPEYGSHLKAMQDMILTINHDKEQYSLARDYVKGDQERPHVPSTARVEVRQIAKRATMNLMPLLIGVPSQMCFIEGFRDGSDLDPPEWEVFTRSKMASKQTIAFKTALTYGNAFIALEENENKKMEMKLLQTSNTVAYYADPVNDAFPEFAMTIRHQPHLEKPGLVVMYDAEAVTYYDWYPAAASSGNRNEDEFKVRARWDHKMPHAPIRRLVCRMDDEGSVTGLVGQLIPMQDRVNQTAFDLLVTQTFSSFKVRWAAGMLGDPVYVIDEETGEEVPATDVDGNQIYKPVQVDQSTWIQTDDPNARVGTLDETPLDGFLESFDTAVRHFAVIGQLPPHNLLGSMSNVNAETLQSAMSQTIRFTHVLKESWGDAIEDLMGMAAIQLGHRDSLEDYEGEVRWRDMSDNTLAAVVDALGKGVKMLGIPKRSAWRRFPGVTHGELMEWEEAKKEEMLEEAMNGFDDVDSAATREQDYSTDPSQMPAEPLEPYNGGAVASP